MSRDEGYQDITPLIVKSDRALKCLSGIIQASAQRLWTPKDIFRLQITCATETRIPVAKCLQDGSLSRRNLLFSRTYAVDQIGNFLTASCRDIKAHRTLLYRLLVDSSSIPQSLTFCFMCQVVSTRNRFWYHRAVSVLPSIHWGRSYRHKASLACLVVSAVRLNHAPVSLYLIYFSLNISSRPSYTPSYTIPTTMSRPGISGPSQLLTFSLPDFTSHWPFSVTCLAA